MRMKPSGTPLQADCEFHISLHPIDNSPPKSTPSNPKKGKKQAPPEVRLSVLLLLAPAPAHTQLAVLWLVALHNSNKHLDYPRLTG